MQFSPAEKIKELSELKTFQAEFIMTLYFTSLIRKKFQVYCCELFISLYKWKGHLKLRLQTL